MFKSICIESKVTQEGRQIIVQGEMIVELGGKKYLVNAPKGVTIKEVIRE